MRVILLLCVVVGMVSAESQAWLVDFKKAQARAQAENKHLLVDFTGSDWCKYCILLKEEVFSKPEFLEAAGKQFVFVEVDYPMRKQQSAELKAQNEMLKMRYNIMQWPTVLLMDSQGQVFARTGYVAGGPEYYLNHLNVILEEKQKREQAILEANTLTGDARVKKLGEILESLMRAQVETGQQEILAMIKKADPEDKLGFVHTYEFPRKLNLIDKNFQMTADADAALASLQDLLKTTRTDEERRDVFAVMGLLYLRHKNDKVTGEKYYRKAADLFPDSDLSKSIYEIIGKTDPEAKGD